MENIPDGPCIIAANHQSVLDGLLVSVFLNRKQLKRTYFYGKAAHIRSWWLKALARTNNVIVIDINRNLREPLRTLAHVLNTGENVIIFPEGTRSREGSLGVFKRTFAILGQELGVPVVPVAINGAYDAMPVGRHIPRLRSPINVSFMPPVMPQPDDAGYVALTDRVSHAVADELAAHP